MPDLASPRVPFLSRLSTRLALVVLALLAGIGLAVGALADRAADRAAVAADQALHRDLAAELAPRFQPYLDEGIDEPAIQGMIDGLTQVNRRLDVYLLGSNGMIKSWFMDADGRPLDQTVDPAALDAFLAGAPLPLLGPDPARPGEVRPFSVAPVRIMDEGGCYLYMILQSERYDAVAESVRREALGGTLLRGLALVLGAAALVGLLLVLALTRPLARLTETVGAFERGALGVRTGGAGTGEVARLGGAFDRMAARIESQVEALKRTDRQRRELVANVSHDLRSPLASLRGYLDTLDMLGDAPAPGERREYLDRALRASDRLGALVADLFDLSRFDAAEIRPALEPTALAELVGDVVADCRAEAEARGVELRVRAQDGLPLARADAGLVERAVVNLLDNAIRHTPPGGAVSVDVARGDAATVAIAVRDTGEGIAPEVLPRVFERFVRADESRTAGAGGAGLGLAIVKRIAELHGGTVRAESVLGKGATFTLALPLGGPPERAEREPAAAREAVGA